MTLRMTRYEKRKREPGENAGRILNHGSAAWKGKEWIPNMKFGRKRPAPVELEWEKRRKPQILSGNSKFSHTSGNREYRHTLWYEPAPMPAENELVVEEFPPEEAETLWLNSFRDQLLCRKLEKTPLIFEKKPGKCRIFSLLYKKNSYFC